MVGNPARPSRPRPVHRHARPVVGNQSRVQVVPRAERAPPLPVGRKAKVCAAKPTSGSTTSLGSSAPFPGTSRIRSGSGAGAGATGSVCGDGCSRMGRPMPTTSSTSTTSSALPANRLVAHAGLAKPLMAAGGGRRMCLAGPLHRHRHRRMQSSFATPSYRGGPLSGRGLRLRTAAALRERPLDRDCGDDDVDDDYCRHLKDTEAPHPCAPATRSSSSPCSAVRPSSG